MSDKGSVFQKGGGGTNFEQFVQTAFLTTLIIRGNVPCVASSELTEVAFQVTNRGYQTDDFLAIAKSKNAQHRLLIQIKHDISFTAGNQIFKEVISSFWKDYNNTSIFDKANDKLIVIKNGLTKDERNHLKSLFNWAANKATEVDFVSEVDRIKGKKERLEVFREVLKEANNNTALSDKELWEFLKCVDVLEYDFLNNGSVHKTNFLNLIKLSKSKDSTATDEEIWNSIFAHAAILNKDGGSVTLESIKNKDFFNHFDNAKLSPYFKAVEKLKSDSKDILKPIKTSIGKGENEFQLPRTEAKEEILDALSNSQLTIVTGKPGVGKSAAIKEILQKDFPNASIFVFRADQFNEPTIANVFSRQGVNESIQDIFSCISLIPEKIIFIDSLEKLLESDPECAFKQQIALLKEHPKIKLIAASRKYAIDLIMLKFGIDKDGVKIIDIPTLNETELNLVSQKFPQLNNVLKNDKIKKLLQSPKYLEFSISAISKTNDDYSNVSLTEFKNKLWDSLVVDSTNTKNGLPIKRKTAFMEIAVKRAKEMKLFTSADMSDAEAIVCLENDEIIFQENQNGKYSPAHDILEDWALVKYVSSKVDENPLPTELFSNLGNEPAIRRAFRLWVEDYLIDNSSKINELIKAAISDQTIDKYWADELLIAVFKSESSSSFFTAFETELLNNNAAFFNRCLHIIKTCCKESNQSNNNFLLPNGSGWKEALFFIQKHIIQLDIIKLTVINFLTGWHWRLLFQYETLGKDELKVTKDIVLHYMREIEDGQEFWQKRDRQKQINNLIEILLDLAEISKEDIRLLVARAFTNKENREPWKLNSFYKSVISECLSGTRHLRLIKELPELIIETAWKNWKYVPLDKTNFSDKDIFFSKQPLRDEECWGIRDKFTFSPSGIYKTPVYNLLYFHPVIGLKFIIDFINYSVEFYINANCEYKHQISQIEIELNNGMVIKNWAAWELWAAYRGLSVTNYTLESLLMSLEKFLLEIAVIKTDLSKKNLKFMFDYVIKNSNNIAPLAVLTSVAIAYPEEVEEAMLPLLSVREFYDWDLHRAIKESSHFSPIDNQIPFAREERLKSNQLPHRRKHQRGLRDFIFDYQLNIRTLNKQIHQIFDKLKVHLLKDDILWKKILIEMDIRNYNKIGIYDEKLGGFLIQPEYDKDVTEFIESNKESCETNCEAMNFWGLLTKAYEKKEDIEFSAWLSCYEQYSKLETFNTPYDQPVTLAVLGLRDFSIDLNETQKKWCIETIFNAIVSILQNTLNRNFSLNTSFNIMENITALSSFHLLMQNVNYDEDKNGIIALMIYMLSAPFDDHEIDKITEYVREIFFTHYPYEARRVWFGLIKHSIYRKANPYFYDDYDSNRLNTAKKNEEKFVQEVSSDKNLKLDLSEINLKTSEGYLLARAFVITPYNTADKEFSDFINHVLHIVLDDFTKEDDGTKQYHNFHYGSVLDIEQYLADLLLNANLDFSKPVLTALVHSLLNAPVNRRFSRKNDLIKFVETTLDYFVVKLYDNGNSNIDSQRYEQQLTKFWNLWEVLFNLIPTNSNHPLSEKLLLDIQFLLFSFNGTPNEFNWDALNGKKDFYKRALLEKGKNLTSSAIKVFSTIGEKEFLPDGISWLVEIFKSDFDASESLTSPLAERMIKQLFYDHISKIKNDKSLIDDYIWILNRMVDLGSSKAYLFRENVITYKSVSK